MHNYRVSFYKDLCNSDGHSFKCLQRQIEVQSTGPSQALVLAERLVDNDRLNADCVEVMHVSSHHGFEHPADHSPVLLTQPWNRVAS